MFQFTFNCLKVLPLFATRTKYFLKKLNLNKIPLDLFNWEYLLFSTKMLLLRLISLFYKYFCNIIRWINGLPFVRTDRLAHSHGNEISLLIKTNHPHQSNPKYYEQRRWFFSKTSWKKPNSFGKMSGLAMVQPTSSDFWKALYEKTKDFSDQQLT